MQSNSGAPALSDYIAAFKRRRLLMALVALPIFAVALLLALGLPDVFRSSALIQIEGDGQRAAFVESAREEPSYADQYVTSLKGVVLADANLGKLLDAEPDLFPDQNTNRGATLKELRSNIDVSIVTVPILDPRTGREREVVTAFTVANEHRDPKKAQKVADWLANEFLAANRNQYRQKAISASQFYTVEAERMGAHIAELEGKLAEFKKENFGRLPELTEVNMNAMDRGERELENLQLQARSLRSERVFLAAQLRQTQEASPDAVGVEQLEAEYQRKSAQYDASHPDLVSLRRQIENMKRGGAAGGGSLQAQLEAQRSVLTEAQQRYSPEHPDVKRIQRNIQALEARIAAGEQVDTEVRTPMAMQLKTQTAAIDGQLASIEARMAEVRGKLEQVESNVVSSPQVERNYQTLTRDLSIARTKYEELLKRQMDAQVSEAAITAGRADEFRIIQPPMVPGEPAKPMRAGLMGLGLMFALVISLAATLLVELLDPTVRGTRDVRSALAISPLAAIPQIRNSVSRRRQLKRAIGGAIVMGAGIFIAYYAIAQTF